MSAEKKLSATQHISGWTLRETEKRPSELMRLFEADLIGRLAREAALAGMQFVAWPTVHLVREENFQGDWRLHAEVVAK